MGVSDHGNYYAKNTKGVWILILPYQLDRAIQMMPTPDETEYRYNCRTFGAVLRQKIVDWEWRDEQ